MAPFERKISTSALLLLGLAALPVTAQAFYSGYTGGFRENVNCPQCHLFSAVTDSTKPLASPAGTSNTDAVNLGINVAALVAPTPATPLAFPEAPLLPQGMINWAPGQELPGAFHRPWAFAPTDFNPAFETSFYSDRYGALNVPSAPWNLYMGKYGEKPEEVIFYKPRDLSPALL
jgi:hypothetical protein